MANGNPILTKQNAAIYGAILLVGGGGGVVGANAHRHEEVSANTEDIVDLKVVQGKVEVRLDNIDKKLEESSKKSDKILEILTNQ